MSHNAQIWTTSGVTKGSVVFPYRGFEISLSTQAQPNEIVIFKGHKTYNKLMTGKHHIGATIDDVVKAQDAIDKYLEDGSDTQEASFDLTVLSRMTNELKHGGASEIAIQSMIQDAEDILLAARFQS